MAKYLLASASGMGFLCLIAGLSPVQALPSLEIADKNVAVNQDYGSYQKNDSHQSNLANNISSKLLIADESPKNLPSVNEQQKIPDLGVDSAVNFWQPIIPQSASSSPTSYKLAQVTSVSQLSDVQPTDWAFQALQSLVERYGCIAGYPNQTYRGNRAMTRYEFAAGLNACLDRINELIATATADLVKKEDLATLQKLQEQFAAELATLRGRVDAVEARTAKLEANQFSTTTKLSGEAIIAGVGASGGAPNNSDSNIILVNRVRLNLTTSFTGKDLLITGLQAYNFLGGANGQGSLQQSLGLAAPLLSASSARTSFEPQFPGLNVNTLSSVGANSVQLYKLLYIFPVANKLTLFAGTAAETSDAFPAITPFYGEGQESISRFAGLNPVLRVSGGTSGTGLASAAGFIFNISPNLDLRALYGSVNANLPQKSATDAVPGVSTTPLGAGLFSGSSVIATQLTFKPSAALDIGLNYAHSYHEINILGTGLVSSDIGALAGVAAGTPVTLNSVGGTVTWRLSPNIALSGYGAALFVDASSNSVNASTTFTSWMAGVHFKDLFKSGNTAGILFGQPLYRTDAGGSAQLTPTGDNRATPYHLEAYYRFQVSDNISITPGAFILFNPEGNSNNETTTVGVLRTTFTF
ncbi:MAG: iron uptake porin [Nostoc sp. NOS(2021)]|uniref:iron uptake porin n=1 Tax=Nostoc sp. NOS(2021) TaxID=2815407 RepID=UPI0025FFF398|nr:iron uptake porin [Nostoc sp. NOS(2021)]MBN3897842.1 iron uptake porin [Nostoc sp. NOS(2021)]